MKKPTKGRGIIFLLEGEKLAYTKCFLAISPKLKGGEQEESTYQLPGNGKRIYHAFGHFFDPIFVYNAFSLRTRNGYVNYQFKTSFLYCFQKNFLSKVGAAS